MKIKCDICRKEFELKNKIKKYSDGVEEVYFKCEHCKERYSSYFTNKSIRIKQNKIRKMREDIKNVLNTREYITMLSKIDDFQKEIKLDMENLKKKMLGTC